MWSLLLAFNGWHYLHYIFEHLRLLFPLFLACCYIWRHLHWCFDFVRWLMAYFFLWFCFFFFLGSSLQPAVSLSPSFLFFPIISPQLPSPQCRNTFYMEDPVSLPASVTRESSVQSTSQWVPSLALDMPVFQIPWVAVVPYLWGTRDEFHGGQMIHRQGWESNDLRMIQEHQI